MDGAYFMTCGRAKANVSSNSHCDKFRWNSVYIVTHIRFDSSLRAAHCDRRMGPRGARCPKLGAEILLLRDQTELSCETVGYFEG